MGRALEAVFLVCTQPRGEGVAQMCAQVGGGVKKAPKAVCVLNELFHRSQSHPIIFRSGFFSKLSGDLLFSEMLEN